MGCPDSYHGIEDDESGQCYPDSEGCPEGMIFSESGHCIDESLCEGENPVDRCPGDAVCLALGCPGSPPDPVQGCDDGRDLVDGICPMPGDPEPGPYPDNPEIPSPPPDLNCGDDGVPDNIRIGDPHGFDEDNDGIGCESNGNGNGDDNGVGTISS